MANVDAFLKALQDFDKDNTPVVACEWVEKNLFTQEKFNPEAMKSKSAAAAGMCAWVINIVKYYRIYEVVEPKRQLLAEANTKLDEANTKLTQVRLFLCAGGSNALTSCFMGEWASLTLAVGMLAALGASTGPCTLRSAYVARSGRIKLSNQPSILSP